MAHDVNFSNESGPTSQTTTTTTTTTTLLSRATRVALELAADLLPISKHQNHHDNAANSSMLILNVGELAENYTSSSSEDEVEMLLQQQQQQQQLQVAATTSITGAPSSVAMSSASSLSKILGQLSSWELALVGLLIALILISIVGNCLVCVAIFTDRRLRKLGNAFIVSLAIADLFVSCLVMTFALANDLMDYWMFGARFCDIWISFDIMCCTASILNLCAISLDRFIHIKDCLLYNQLMTRRVAISAVIGIWIISALVSFVPINLGWHKPSHFKSAELVASNNNSNSQHLLQRRLVDQMQVDWPIEAAHAHTHAHADTQSETRIVPFQSVKFAQEPRDGHTRAASLHNSSAAVHENENDDDDAQAQVDFRKLAGQTSGWQRRRRRRRRSTGQNYSPDDQVQSNPSGEQQQQQIKQTKRVAKKARRHSSDQTTTTTTPLNDQQSSNVDAPAAHLPQCMLTLTPTYAIISSTISFYIPCLIMLGLYSRLFACARRHVRNIRAITRAPNPIGGQQAMAAANCPQTAHDNQHLSSSTSASSSSAATRQESSKLAARARTWIKFRSLGKAPLACELTSASSRPLAADQRTGSVGGGGGGGKVFETIDKITSAQQTETEPFLGPTGSGDGDLSAGRQATRQQKVALNLSATTLKLSTGSSGPPASQLQQQQPQQQQQQSLAAQVQQQQQHKQQTSQLATHKAAITLGIIMGTFLFCWVPFFCLNIIKAFCVDSIPSSMFRAFTWLGYANSALNPIIYGIHNSEFRNAFNRIFFKHLTLKNGRQYLNRRFSYDLRNHHHHHHAHNQQPQNYNSTPQRNVNVLAATAPNVHVATATATTTTTPSTTNENANNGNHHRNHLAAATRQDHNNNNNTSSMCLSGTTNNDYLPTKAELSSGTNVVPTAAAAPAVVEKAAPTNLRSCPTVS